MQQAELRWLAERASEARLIVEIGSWKGRSTRALADHTSGTVIVIDNWQDPLEGTDQTNQELATKGAQAIYTEWSNNLEDLIEDGKVQLINKSSADAVSSVKSLVGSRRPDLIFIDADHTEAGCRRDIALYQPLVKKGGLLCGHDYGVKAHPGVKLAVDAVFGSRAAVGPKTIWSVRV